MKVSYQHDLLEAGCDEAGRGCYAGPVFAAAVILKPNFYHPHLNDSKLLKPSQRNLLRKVIEHEAVSFSVASVSNQEIDEINILNASIKAMHIALSNLSIAPQFIVVDGNRFIPYQFIPHLTIIKGDGKYANIAAASILAKTYRDEWIEQLHPQFPYYDWINNKGYGTKKHREAILQHGLCEHHRKSFNI